MADNREIIEHVVRSGREYIQYSDGSQWTRKLDRKTGHPRSDWTEVEAPVEQEPEALPLHLSVVVQRQAEGEPSHWSLFSHRPDADGTGRGQVWQVKGDAERMHYQHASDVNILRSASFHWHQVMNTDLTDSQYARVDRIAQREPPPRAANRRAVTENCQGWVIRVLWQLVDARIVDGNAVTTLQQYMDPIN